MDDLKKKFDDGIGKLDVSIKALKEQSDVKFEEVKQPILGTPLSQSTHVNLVPQITKENQISNFLELEDSNKHELGKLEDMIDDRTRKRTCVGLGFEATWMQPIGFGRGFWTEPQPRVNREMKHMHRVRKLKMPVFEGEDAYGWIYRVERYFEIQGLSQQEQLRATALCMEGEALSWYRWSVG
ncbi:hypothetical protein Tco_0704647 [Tanacetum coccineum]|uniref:Retrotransposon gag domain-containing protein n=1 Tax=Tanacetum coccineum TaxID=301880 RepID=A0ABQ4Y3R3_9ASTR